MGQYFAAPKVRKRLTTISIDSKLLHFGHLTINVSKTSIRHVNGSSVSIAGLLACGTGAHRTEIKTQIAQWNSAAAQNILRNRKVLTVFSHFKATAMNAVPLKTAHVGINFNLRRM